MTEDFSTAVRTEVDSYLAEKDNEGQTIDDIKTLLAAAAAICVVGYTIKKTWQAAVRRQARKDRRKKA
jgi:hypothetical protein